jgi:hypothetical protein
LDMAEMIHVVKGFVPIGREFRLAWDAPLW